MLLPSSLWYWIFEGGVVQHCVVAGPYGCVYNVVLSLLRVTGQRVYWKGCPYGRGSNVALTPVSNLLGFGFDHGIVVFVVVLLA